MKVLSPKAGTVGQLGGTYYTSGGKAKCGCWGSLQCITECRLKWITVLAGITDKGVPLYQEVYQIDLYPGMTLFGVFVEVKITSGSVLVYNTTLASLNPLGTALGTVT